MQITCCRPFKLTSSASAVLQQLLFGMKGTIAASQKQKFHKCLVEPYDLVQAFDREMQGCTTLVGMNFSQPLPSFITHAHIQRDILVINHFTCHGGKQHLSERSESTSPADVVKGNSSPLPINKIGTSPRSFVN